MTRQYLIGEMSALLAELCPAADPRLAVAVEELRREVEGCPWGHLPGLFERAMVLADRTCWSAIDAGNLGAFERQASAAEHLCEFASAAGIASRWRTQPRGCQQG